MKRSKTYPTKKIARWLSDFEKFVQLGYSHENFCKINRTLRELEYYLDKDDLEYLKEVWRDSYTDNVEESVFALKMQQIKFKH